MPPTEVLPRTSPEIRRFMEEMLQRIPTAESSKDSIGDWFTGVTSTARSGAEYLEQLGSVAEFADALDELDHEVRYNLERGWEFRPEVIASGRKLAEAVIDALERYERQDEVAAEL